MSVINLTGLQFYPTLVNVLHDEYGHSYGGGRIEDVGELYENTITSIFHHDPPGSQLRHLCLSHANMDPKTSSTKPSESLLQNLKQSMVTQISELDLSDCRIPHFSSMTNLIHDYAHTFTSIFVVHQRRHADGYFFCGLHQLKSLSTSTTLSPTTSKSTTREQTATTLSPDAPTSADASTTKAASLSSRSLRSRDAKATARTLASTSIQQKKIDKIKHEDEEMEEKEVEPEVKEDNATEKKDSVRKHKRGQDVLVLPSTPTSASTTSTPPSRRQQIQSHRTFLSFPNLTYLAISITGRFDADDEQFLFDRVTFPKLQQLYIMVHPLITSPGSTLRHHSTCHSHVSTNSTTHPRASDTWPLPSPATCPCYSPFSYSEWNALAERHQLQTHGVTIQLYITPLASRQQQDAPLNSEVFKTSETWDLIPKSAHVTNFIHNSNPQHHHLHPDSDAMDTSSSTYGSVHPPVFFPHTTTSTPHPFQASRSPAQVWRIDEIWNELGTKGKGIRIAILDTGFDLQGPYRSQVQRAEHAISVVPHHNVAHDPQGHGTHVAGIISTIAPEAQLILIKVFPDRGNGLVSWFTEGLKEALRLGADVISLSGGTLIDDEHLYQQTYQVLGQQKILVAAASNEGGKQQFGIHYPAAYGGVLCVGSHGPEGERSSFSPTGPELDFLAPGELIQSSAPGNRTAVNSGTSMACPFVSGLVALLLSSDRSVPLHLRTPNTTISSPSAPSVPPCKLHNSNVVRTVLREMTTKRGHHSLECGRGMLDPWLLLRYGRDHMYRIISRSSAR